MSYSESARGSNKSEALAALMVKLDGVVTSQPVHAQNIPFVKTAVTQMADLLPVDDSKDVALSVSGGISGDFSDATAPKLSYVNMIATVSLAAR